MSRRKPARTALGPVLFGLLGLCLAGCTGNSNEPPGPGTIHNDAAEPAGSAAGVGVPSESGGAVPSPSPANPATEPADVPRP